MHHFSLGQSILFGQSTSYIVTSGNVQKRMARVHDITDDHRGQSLQIRTSGDSTHMQFYASGKDTPHTTLLALGREAERQGNVINLDA